MKLGLIVPSRERIQHKKDLINSIIKTVDNINNVVLYFGIDDNDPTKPEALKLAKEHSFIRIVEIHNEGKFLGLGKLWNLCANQCKEEILAMIGDDMVFVTRGWDSKIIEEFSGNNCPKDNVKMVYCYDGRHGAAISVNAFVHRRYMEINGYFMREEFKVDFIDLWLQQIFTAIGRIKYRGDIHIEHKHWSFGKSKVDGISSNLRGNNYPAMSQKMWIDTKDERIKEVHKIGKLLGIPVNLSKINGLIPG